MLHIPSHLLEETPQSIGDLLGDSTGLVRVAILRSTVLLLDSSDAYSIQVHGLANAEASRCEYFVEIGATVERNTRLCQDSHHHVVLRFHSDSS